jgi:hypothetical protein
MLGDGIRRNIATVSKEERDRFRDAIVKLQTGFLTYSDGRPFFQKQEWIHWAGHQLAHTGPAFLAWHRQLCNHFEALLRVVDPQLSLHYWDWTTDPRALTDIDGNPLNLFTSEFMGDDGHLAINRVATDGGGDTGAPFLNFPTIVSGQAYPELGGAGGLIPTGNLADLPSHTVIWRAVGPAGVDPTKAGAEASAERKPVPPTPDPNTGGPNIVSLTDAASKKGVALDTNILTAADGLSFKSQFSTFTTALLGSHNYIHQYMSGTEGTEHVSSGDPFFFIIHSNLDRLWATWQRSRGTANTPDAPDGWGLDPNKTYGTLASDNTTGSFPPWDGTPGVLLPSPLVPWVPGSHADDASLDPNHAIVQWPAQAAIATATEGGTTVTITTTAPHGFQQFDEFGAPVAVNVVGVGVAGYNGSWLITGIPTSASFTYTAKTSGLTASGGGTASSPRVGVAAAPTGATQVGTTVTITTTGPHGLLVGDLAIVRGVGVASYNGVWAVTAVPTSTSFQFTTTAGLAASGGGSARSAKDTGRDPAILIPASYDTAVHASYIVVNRDTFSTSEINTGTLTYPNAFYVIYDGFTPAELKATPPGTPANLPTFSFAGASKISAALATVNPVNYENPGGAVDMPQRIMLSFDLKFADGSDFPAISGAEKLVSMQASLNYNVETGTGGTVVPMTAVASTELALVNQPNPYMDKIDPTLSPPNPYWLSIDTRVFQVMGPGGGNPAGSVLGVTQGDMDADHNGPFTFINGVLSALQGSPSKFDDTTIFPTDETASELQLSQKAGPGNSQRVYNYVVARVRYLAPAGVPATGVSVFFRVFSTAVSALDYDATSGTRGNYRRTGNTNASSVALLGIENDSQGQSETASIPFFASKRVRASSSDFNDGTAITSMTTQPADSTNIQTISGTGSENVTFFGAWLDINLASGDPNYHEFPLNADPANPDGGPFTVATQSIQQLMLNTHHCLVAEIFFWPPGTSSDPIPHDASPASSDRLAQRNLVLVKSGNPGFPATHQVQTTFIVKPSVVLITQPGAVAGAVVAPAATVARHARRGRHAAEAQPAVAVVGARYRGPDELIIRWNNVPRNSEARIYMPEVEADEILALSALRQHPTVLTKIDAHTLGVRLADVTFMPLPMNREGTIAGLMSLTLPHGIRAGQVYRFSVEQYSGFTLKTLGAFQMTIPVRPDDELLPEEMRKLSVMRYIQQAIPITSRWYRIFVRYIDEIAARVRGFGGDPNAVKPSPDGSGGLLPPPVCPPPKPVRPPELFCLNIPWEECDIEGELEVKLRFRRKCK